MDRESLRIEAIHRCEDIERALGFDWIADDETCRRVGWWLVKHIINSDANFRMDLGWINLLQQAADRVRTYPAARKVKIDGGKEKCCCVVHIDCDNSQRGCRSEVERLCEGSGCGRSLRVKSADSAADRGICEDCL